MDRDIVYVGTGNGPPFKVYALDAKTGAILWSRKAGDQILTTAAVSDTSLYVGRWEGGILALDKATGATQWIFPTEGGVGLSSPVLANGVLYVGDGAGLVYALDAASGQKLWSYQTGATTNFSPAVVNGMLYIGSFDKNLYAFSL